VYDIHNSDSWKSIGAFQLGLKTAFLGGNGDYGRETLIFDNQRNLEEVKIDSVLMAGINDTNYYNGFIGVGAIPGDFPSVSFPPLINQLVETTGSIPSHSYGYTAGASYVGTNAGVSGTPASLTLGGYDVNRFEPHEVTFSIDKDIRLPQARLRGIVATVPSADKAPAAWGATSRTLVSMNDSLVATIDSSTPYLWLPGVICDRFAEALGLAWNETFGLYLFKNNEQYLEFQKRDSLSFTFALSSYQNLDDFGQPFNTPGVVNITVSSAAFALTVQFPFGPMKFKDPAVPYFPLMKATGNHAIVIGRAFMQEAYMVTRYEESKFALYQAKFPQDAAKNTKIMEIQPTPNDLFSVYQGSSGSGGLSTAATAGIVVSACVVGSFLALALWLCRRRKKTQRELAVAGKDDEMKDTSSSVGSEPPSSPIERIFSFIIRRKKSRKPGVAEVDGTSKQLPVEVGAEKDNQLYEMEVPPEPVELDGTCDGSIGDDTTEFGTEGSQGLSPYEVARLKMQRQLQGPVPSYTPPAPGTVIPGEKTEDDVSPVVTHRPADDASPVSTSTYGNSDSYPNTLPSPLSPHDNWTNRWDLPSPMTVTAPPLPSLLTRVSPAGSTEAPSPLTYNPSSMSRSSSSNGSTTHSPSSLVPPSAAYQRTPIDPSRVICLGPLPENVSAPAPTSHPVVPRIIVPVGDASVSAPSEDADTLGSNFTIEEEERRHAAAISPVASTHSVGDGVPPTPNSAERIDAAVELVHVPQLAERRYSWEEDHI
jgi:hypothetical protein